MLSVSQENNRAAIQRNTEAIERSKSAERGRDTLQKALDELKGDNERQTKLITCLLIIHGENIKISNQDQVRCRQALEAVNLDTGSTK